MADIMVDTMHMLAITDTVVTIDTSVTMDLVGMDTDTGTVMVMLHTLFPLTSLLVMVTVTMDTVMACI